MNKKYMTIGLFFMFFMFFAVDEVSANGKPSSIIPNTLIQSSSGAQVTVSFGDTNIYCRSSTTGYWGWAFINSETAVQGSNYDVKNVEVYSEIKNKLDNSVYRSSRGKILGFSLDSLIYNASYSSPKNPENYYIETSHRVQDKETKEWYRFTQRQNILYTPKSAYFYENSQRFALEK